MIFIGHVVLFFFCFDRQSEKNHEHAKLSSLHMLTLVRFSIEWNFGIQLKVSKPIK